MVWSKSRVLVTGATGFVGRHVVTELRSRQPAEILAPAREVCDLRDANATRAFLNEARPDVVIHLAARVGGIGANRASPATFFYENAVMGIELMEASRLAGVTKFVGLGTVCSYPASTPVPFREDDLWNGYPEPTNAPYGLAKKMLLVQAQAYRAQYGFDAIHLLMVNLYGPGDRFDLESSHVIPALIRKFSEARDAGEPRVTLWGSGTPTREFLHVRDGARAIVLAAQRYGGAEPVNVGGSREIAIRDLAELIASIVGFEGEIVWDRAKPDGQMRRKLDVERAKRAFGFEAEVELEDGLRETVAWYRAAMERVEAGAFSRG